MKVRMIYGARGPENRQLLKGRDYEVPDELATILIRSGHAVPAPAVEEQEPGSEVAQEEPKPRKRGRRRSE